MRSLPYEIVDVFTDRPFAGNPLAVVFDAADLDTSQMQAMAREFNLSETVFVLPAAAPRASYRARVFTPAVELPFAGHPSVGAAVTAVRRGLLEPGALVQECGAGLVPVEVAGHRGTLAGAAPTVGDPLDPAPLAGVVGLRAGDLAGAAPRRAGCGLEFTYLAVHPDAVGRAVLDPAAARASGYDMVSVFAWDPDTRTARTRVFCPGVGVAEDPATGSAALGFGVWLAAAGLTPADGALEYVVRQGLELHRPSTLECAVRVRAGAAVRATVSGQVAAVASGTVVVPPFVG
jgi:trans-2,3-dihydro-3-hydroxyanthranilate isomerase